MSANTRKQCLPAIVSAKSGILILGTMPSEESLNKAQYYANRMNQFWKLLAAVFNEPVPPSYLDRISFLHGKGIAVWDVLKSCDRAGSSDAHIGREVPNDFAEFYELHPSIRTVYFNGQKARDLYAKYVRQSYGRPMRVLPSSSSARAMQFEAKLKEWRATADDAAGDVLAIHR